MIDATLARQWLKVILSCDTDGDPIEVLQMNATRLMQTMGCEDMLNMEHPVVAGLLEKKAANIASLTTPRDH